MRRFAVSMLLHMCAVSAIGAAAAGPAHGQQLSATSSGLTDRQSITFEAAITIEAIQRSNNATVRSLRDQITKMKSQVAAGRGNVSDLRRRLAGLQEEMVSRLAETDSRYAAERDAFVQAIAVLFMTDDAQLLALLHRYAEGDSGAITELQRFLRSSSIPKAERALSQRAFATLMLDAARRKRVDERKAIAAYEAVLDDDPQDFVALQELYNFYVHDFPERARTLAERLHRQWESFGDPAALASSLQSLAITNLRSGDVDRALEFGERSVAAARAYAAETHEQWKAKHAGATEPAWMIENHKRERLAISLRTLAVVQKAKGDLRSAALSAMESGSLRRVCIDVLIKANQKVGSTPYDYAAASTLDAGAIYGEAGDWSAALSAYRLSVDLSLDGARETLREKKSKEPLSKPFWALIPFAEAAIHTNRLEDAERALADSWEGIRAAEPSAFVLGEEGLYWLQVGHLRVVRGETAEARTAWESAEVALSQAVSLEKNDERWSDALKTVERLLARVPEQAAGR